MNAGNEPGAAASGEGRRAFLLYLSCAGAIAALLSLYFVVRHRGFAFVDIGIDTYSYYYAFQIAHARQLHELHTLTWSFDAGLGSYIGWLSNALAWFNALFPESWQLGLRLPAYMLRLLLAGGFMFGYLRKLDFEPRIATAGALAYAFCGYAMINGQWDTQGYLIPQLAAYLFLFECYFRHGKARYAIAAGLVACTGATFDTYTFTLVSLLYVATRPFLVSKENDAAPYLPSLVRYTCWAALGAMLAAIILLPNLIYFLSSPRVSGDHSILSDVLEQAWTLNSKQVIAAEVAGLFGKGLLGTGSKYVGYSNWFEAPGFYISMLMLTCIPQLLGPNATRRERLVCIAGLVLLLVYLLWPFMRYAVYGFGHRGFRVSTLWVSFGLLILGVAGLRRIYRSGTWRTGLAASTLGIVVVVLVVASRLASHIDFRHLGIVIGFTLVYCALLWPSGDNRPRVPVTAVVVILACELLMFALPPTVQRTSVRSDGASRVGSYHDGTAAALALIRDADHSGQFHRIEKTYRSLYLNDALVQDYSGTKSYFFHSESITRFIDRMELKRPHPRTNYIGPMVDRPKVLDLLGVKYLLARDRKLNDTPGMAYVGSAGKIHVYRNTDAHGVAHLYRDVTSEEAADKLSRSRRDALLLDQVVVADPESIRAQLAALDTQQSTQTAALPSRVSLRKASDIHLQADVSTPLARILLVAMPFDSGWTASVDGTTARLLRADYGLTALLLPPGQHQVELHYAVPGRAIGTWLSLAALALLLAIGIFRIWTRKRQTGARIKNWRAFAPPIAPKSTSDL